MAVSPESGSIDSRGAVLTLILLACLNLSGLADRYIVPAVQTLIKQEFRVSDSSLGALSSIFFLAFMASLPIMGWFGRQLPLKLMTCGAAALWSLFTFLTANSHSYRALLINHAAFAVGEASFAIFAPVLIAQNYGPGKRHRAMTFFALTVPVGTAAALGMGSLADDAWRIPMYRLAVIGGVASILSLLLIKEPKEQPEEQGIGSSSEHAVRSLFRNTRYLATVIGGCSLSFSMVGLFVWLPTFLTRKTGLPLAHVNQVLGTITVCAGALGVLLGGLVADRWLLRNRAALYLVSAASLAMAAICETVALFGPEKITLPAIAVTQLFFFFNTAPMGAAILNALSRPLRATGLALSMFLAHAFGDSISPVFVGWIAERMTLRAGMGLAVFPLFVGTIALLRGARAMQLSYPADLQGGAGL